MPVDRTEMAYPNLSDAELVQLGRLLNKATIKTSPTANSLERRAQGVAIAERIYKFRRQRERKISSAFQSELFADPAWDMLLDLYVNSARGIRVSVSSACIGASAPATTALRYFNELVRLGMIERFPHPEDRRSIQVALSAAALDMMDDVCNEFADLLG